MRKPCPRHRAVAFAIEKAFNAIMNKEVIEVQVRAVLPLEASYAVFLGNEEKCFVIYVDEPVGTAISMFMRGVPKERPLTHDLLASVLMAFGGKVERVVVNHLSGSVFHARLILSAENELHAKKLIEVDARPSDCVAMAVQSGAPIFVARQVWEAVDDMTETLEEIEKKGAQSGRSGAEEPDNEPAGDEDFEEEDEEDFEDDDLEEEDEEDEPGDADSSSPQR
jgi:bifunctional DNase/RNase